MISDFIQVISILSDVFSSFITSDFNLDLQKFVKSHCLYEFDRKIIFFEKNMESFTNYNLQCIWLYLFLDYSLRLIASLATAHSPCA